MARKTGLTGEGTADGTGGVVRDLPDGPPDETGLTARQRKVLEVIRDSVERRGYPPTVREIGEHAGILSPNGVICHLSALERKGYITRREHVSRGIFLVAEPVEA